MIDLALLALRLGLGIVFLAHGPIKLLQTEKMAKTLRLTPAFVVVIGFMETVGALALLLGVWEEAGASLLGLVMLGAIYFKTQKWGKGFTGENGFELDFILLTAALAILLAGGGSYVLG